MKKICAVCAITLVYLTASNANASNFFGASVTDKDVPTIAWKVGVVGYHPTVNEIMEDSPAQKAGLVKGDIILSINNKAVKSALELREFRDSTLNVEIASGPTRRLVTINRGANDAERVTKTASSTSKPSVAALQTTKNQGALKPAPSSQRTILDELVVVAGHRRDMNDLFGRGGHSDFEQFMSEVYSPEVAEEIFKRSLVRKLDTQELTEILAWYKSPLGAKIVEADSILDFNSKGNAYIYCKVNSVPGFKERMALTGQIEKAVGATEIEVKLSKLLLNKMINAIPHDFPEAKRAKEEIKERIPSLDIKRQENVQKLAYTYRHLSLRELHSYLSFLHSNTGRKYSTAVKEGNEEIFKKVVVSIEKDFRNDIRMITN